MWFQATFGNIDFGKFLRKTTHYISLSDLQELATKIGWEMEIEKREAKISLGTTKVEIITALVKQGITNGDELKKK